MKRRERPILFSGEMVRALLGGRKSQTRRVVTPQPGHFLTMSERTWKREATASCPFGQPGDRLWVREAHLVSHGSVSHAGRYSSWAEVTYRADDGRKEFEYEGPVVDDPYLKAFERQSGCWRPSIFMPRILSRLTLEITEVRVQRVQEIRHDEIALRAEGMELSPSELFPSTNTATKLCRHYEKLWDSLNVKRGYGWDANPWVWAISFRRVSEGTTP